MTFRAEGETRKAEASGPARGASVASHLLFTSSCCLLPSALGWAAHPFITDDTGTQGKGNWQLELQCEHGRNDATADAGAGPVSQESKASLFTSVLTYGLLENLDVALGLNRLDQRVTENGAVTEDSAGMADSTIELKWRFYEADAFSLALKPGLLLPTGDEDKGLGAGSTSWGVALLATYEADPWTFLGNVAYSKVRFKLPQDAADSHSDLWRVSGGLSYALTGEVRLVGEAGLRRNESKNDPLLPDRTSQFVMAGVIYSPTKKMDFDAGFRKNLNDAEFDQVLLVGATFRW
jgi:hypothetical protein